MTARETRRAKREPREIKFAEIEQTFVLESYWAWTGEWAPAVAEGKNGYQIRVVKSIRTYATGEQITYDYFELDRDGMVLVAPRGHAKDFKPGRVIDIDQAVERFATPDPNARRFRIGGW